MTSVGMIVLVGGVSGSVLCVCCVCSSDVASSVASAGPRVSPAARFTVRPAR